MDNPILLLVSRWLHILPAIALVGGAIFLRFAAQASGSDEGGTSAAGAEATRSRWAKLVMISSGLLLLSGLFNTGAVSMKYSFPEKFYHPVLGVKIILAMAVFALSALLSGRSELAKKVQQKERTWMNVNLLLAVAVVMAGGFLKSAEREEKTKDDAPQTRHASQPADRGA